jgi:hypothetical protein
MSNVAIYKSIKKYVGLMRTHLEKITANISDPWRRDVSEGHRSNF